MSVLSDVGSAAAFVVSAYSLYQTTLKRAAIKVFVSPVIRYASPFQNSNFEAFAVPVTLTNEGARSGIIVSMDLQVRAPERDVIKRFYSADIGQWSIEKIAPAIFARSRRSCSPAAPATPKRSYSMPGATSR
jgi:hypothetical protein